MKRLLILILTFCFFSSCRQDEKKTLIKNINTKIDSTTLIKGTHSKIVKDTIISSPNIIFVMPNETEIEILKKKHGEDNFYTLADDINFYMAEIRRSLKTKNVIFSTKKSYYFDKQDVIISKNDFKDPWFIIDYIKGKPLKYSLVDYYSKINRGVKSLSTFENNNNFFIKDIDINNDGVSDKIVSSKPYKGNSLYFFCKKNNNFVFVLESVNFSEDGGNIIKNIYSSQEDKKTFLLHTVFPDGGNFQAFHYIKYNDSNNWELDKTVYEKTNWQNSKTYVCDIKQGVNMKDFLSGEGFKQLNSIPESISENEMCKIKK